MDALAFRDAVIRPVLVHLCGVEPRLGSKAAEVLLLGTALKESELRVTRQVDGPALSFFQIEPATYHDIYERYLEVQRRDLMGPVNDFLMPAWPPHVQLEWNQHFACALARIKYWMSPRPLPPADNLDAMAVYWDEIYNANPSPRTGPEGWIKTYKTRVPRKEW